MRILYVTYAPSTPASRPRIERMAMAARNRGDTLLVAVAHGTLEAEDAAGADAAGIEYVFLLGEGSFVSRRRFGGWNRLLASFRPDIVHLSADVPSDDALHLARSARRTRAVSIVEVDGSEALAKTLGGQKPDLLQCATQVLCPDGPSALQLSRTAHVPLARISTLAPRMWPNSPESPTLVAICAASDERSIRFVLDLLAPLLLAHRVKGLVLNVQANNKTKALLSEVPGDVRHQVRLLSRGDLLDVPQGIAAVIMSHVGDVAVEYAGTALAIDIPVMAPDSLSARLGSETLPGVTVVRRGDTQQCMHAIIEVLNNPVKAENGKKPLSAIAEQEVTRIQWIYHSILLREGRLHAIRPSRARAGVDTVQPV